MGASIKPILWRPVVPSAIVLLGCVAIGATMVSIGSRMLVDHPVLAQIFIGVVAVLAGLSGLVSFWLFADAVRFVSRGYRIRQLPPREYWRWTPGPKACVYEELLEDGGICQLLFVREILGDGYPAPSLVWLPNERTWERQTPEWARGRRAQIVQRIRESAGDETQFADGDHRAG